MYTRCSHCNAVFRVTMKELTAAQGKLRCGECAGVFNAMDSLSTKLPNHTDPAEKISFDSLNKKQQSKFTVSGSSGHPQKENIKASENTTEPKIKTRNTRNVWPLLIIFALITALATQIWFSRDLWFSKLRQPDKVKILSKKVFSHPTQPDALIITASIKSFTKESQPFPYLEARLLDARNQTIALRRFRPHEYLTKYQPDELLEGNKEVSIRLKIKDPPGNQAKHFQFSFL